MKPEVKTGYGLRLLTRAAVAILSVSTFAVTGAMAAAPASNWHRSHPCNSSSCRRPSSSYSKGSYDFNSRCNCRTSSYRGNRCCNSSSYTSNSIRRNRCSSRRCN